MKILIIHNPKVIGGSSKSLMLLINELKKHSDIEFYFFISKGQFEEWVKKEGYNYESITWISHFDNTRYGYYRGKRWFILFREIFFLPFSIFKLIKILLFNKFDMVIINEMPLCLYALILKKFFNLKIIQYVRSVQSTSQTLRTRFFEIVLSKYIDCIISIDNSVKNSLPLSVQEKVKVIHNGYYKPYFSTQKKDGNKDFFDIGFIGSISDLKGFYELLEALKILVNDRGYKKIRLNIAGQPIRIVKNKIFKFLLEVFGFYKDPKLINEYIVSNALEKNVIFWGFIQNLDEFYNNIDLLIFPSKLNAVGRPVFEAGFYEIPSIVAIEDPSEDTFIHMKTGISIKKPDPIAIADAVEVLYNNKELLVKLGQGAKELAERNFDIEKNAVKILEIMYSLYNEQQLRYKQ